MLRGVTFQLDSEYVDSESIVLFIILCKYYKNMIVIELIF